MNQPLPRARSFFPSNSYSYSYSILLPAALAFALALPSPAAAHSRPLSYSFLHAEGDHVDVRVQLAPADLAVLGFLRPEQPQQAERAGRLLQRQLTIAADAGSCVPASTPLIGDAPDTWRAWYWTVRCPGPPTAARQVHAGFDPLLRMGHRHLVRFEHAGQVTERVLELAAADWRIEPAAAHSGSGLLDYVTLGCEHLLTGWDHLAFVLALLLLCTRLRDVVVLVTAFTLAHSLSLALAVLDVVHARPAPVEALIGFSIALLGVENCWLLGGRGRYTPRAVVLVLVALALLGAGTVDRLALAGLALFCACHFALLARAREPAALRVAVAFAFGLIHGFGFAAAMMALALPAGRLAPALLGFNLGVELAQLAVVLIAWPLLRALGRVRDGQPARLFTETASAAVAGLGVFWFATRAFS